MFKYCIFYFLSIVYLYPSIQGFDTLLVLLLLPATLLIGWFSLRLVFEQALLIGVSKFKEWLPYDWQKLFALFAVSVLLIGVARGDPTDAVAISLLTLLLVLLIHFGAQNAVDVGFVQIVFLVSCIGSVISYHLGFNDFGYLPWQERGCTFEGVFRVSLYPNLPDSALFSILVLLVSFYYRSRYSILVVPLAAYFSYFSFSRTVLAIVVIVIFVEFLVRLRIKPNISFMLITSFLVSGVFYVGEVTLLLSDVEKHVSAITKGDSNASAITKSIGADTTPSNGSFNANSPSVSYYEKILMRQECGKADEANLSLSSRADLWRDHFMAFWSSPLTGVGRDGARARLSNESSHSSRSGSESFLTRILAEFGVVALIFWAALWRLFVFSYKRRNGAARSLVAALLVILALYGSSATPYSFLFMVHVALIGYVLSDKEVLFDQSGTNGSGGRDLSASADAKNRGVEPRERW